MIDEILGMRFSHFVGNEAFQSPQKRLVALLITSFGVKIFSYCWRHYVQEKPPLPRARSFVESQTTGSRQRRPFAESS
jgi:hypothetical protein